MRAYQQAKHDADAALAAAGLDHTIVRPGMLTDDPATGTVSAGPDVGRDEVTREDVAAVLAEVLRPTTRSARRSSWCKAIPPSRRQSPRSDTVGSRTSY